MSQYSDHHPCLRASYRNASFCIALFSASAALAQSGGSVISPLFTSTGSVSIKPGIDTATAIQLQSAAGTDLMNLNTNNGNIGIGTTASNRLVVGSDNIGPTGAPASSIAVASTSTNSVVTVGQDATNRAFFGWNYNATPANAYITLGAISSGTRTRGGSIL